MQIQNIDFFMLSMGEGEVSFPIDRAYVGKKIKDIFVFDARYIEYPPQGGELLYQYTTESIFVDLFDKNQRQIFRSVPFSIFDPENIQRPQIDTELDFTLCKFRSVSRYVKTSYSRWNFIGVCVVYEDNEPFVSTFGNCRRTLSLTVIGGEVLNLRSLLAEFRAPKKVRRILIQYPAMLTSDYSVDKSEVYLTLRTKNGRVFENIPLSFLSDNSKLNKFLDLTDFDEEKCFIVNGGSRNINVNIIIEYDER